MDLEGVLLSVVSQRKMNVMISCVCGIWNTKRINKDTDL